MTGNFRKKHTLLPQSSMMWALDDRAIEDRSVREHGAEDILRAGFDGIIVFVRGSRYTWADPEAVEALAHVTAYARSRGMIFWLGADPRFISRRLISGDGKRVVVSGDATVPRRTPLMGRVADRQFSVRCRIRKRTVHTMNEVAVIYHPVGIYHARLFDDAMDDGVDITAATHFFYNANEEYVEAFGALDRTVTRNARVMVVFHFQTNHFDYGNDRHRIGYLEELSLLHSQGVQPHAIVWDEAGYPCVRGCFPITEDMCRHGGNDQCGAVWKLLRDSRSGDHVPYRLAYHGALQQEINEAKTFCNSALERRGMPFRIDGIHDTWRWESADSADRLHGSLDLWKSNHTNSAGFVDLGSVQLLKDPEADFYANLAGISATALSLGRQSRFRTAFNNLWTVGEDETQCAVLDHCMNILALFGLRWIAHIYGPSGVIGEHASFLGLDATPGYPDHSTWNRMPEWNTRLQGHRMLVEQSLPQPDVFMVFPLQTLSVLKKTLADAVFHDIFRLILTLTDHHYTVELVSYTEYARKRRSLPGSGHATHTIFPYPLNRKSFERISRRSTVQPVVYGSAELTKNIREIKPGGAPVVETDRELVSLLDSRLEPRILIAPPHCWATRTPTSHGMVLTLAPARYGRTFQGTLIFGGTRVDIPRQRGLCRVLFNADNEVTARV